MSKCTDKRIQDMLFAYELGQLSEEERREIGVHIIECTACYEEIKKLRAMSAMLRDDSDARDCINRVVEDHTSRTGARSKASSQRTWRIPLLGRVAICIASIALILMLTPWQIQISPSDEATASQDKLLVMDFESNSDENQMGEIAAGLVIADLSESGFIQLISRQRIHDVIRQLEKEGNDVSGGISSSEIALATGSRWMLTGRVLKSEDEIVVNTQLEEVSSGDLVASQNVTGQEMFSIVDKLTIKVKNALPLPEAATNELDRPVADITTHSQLAYRHYLRGLVNYHRYYNADAAESFGLAIAEDSTYAMAYYYLSLTSNTQMISRALEFADKAGQNDRYFIRSREAFLAGEYDRAIEELQQLLARDPENKEAYYMSGICHSMLLGYEKSIDCYRRATAIDPLYKTAYNQLAYTYDWIGEFEKSIEAINTYISIAPDEANPYDSRGDIYARNGRLRLAIDSYEEALRIKPDFWNTLRKLGNDYLLIGNSAKADSCYAILAVCSSPRWRSQGMAARAYVPLREGRFDDAIRVLDEGLATVEDDPEGRDIVCFGHLKSVAYEESGNYQMALAEIEKSIAVNTRINPGAQNYNKHLLIRLLTKTGNTKRAETVAEEFSRNLKTAQDSVHFAFGVAAIELSKDNIERAIVVLEETAGDSSSLYAPANFLLGQSYFDTRRYEETIAELKKLYVNYADNSIVYGSFKVKAHYLMGKAYQNLGNTELAIEQYSTFLDLWQNADPDMAELEDARIRLNRLKNAS